MEVRKGGCQCGAVRFKVFGPLGHASICHCRMCQKAFGNFFAPLVSVRDAEVVWMREEPARFQSSNLVKRGFCEKCGTPLTYEAPDGMALSIAAFDHPIDIEPEIQFGTEGRLSYLDRVNEWPKRETLDDINNAPFLDQIVSYQHPDED